MIGAATQSPGHTSPIAATSAGVAVGVPLAPPCPPFDPPLAFDFLTCRHGGASSAPCTPRVASCDPRCCATATPAPGARSRGCQAQACSWRHFPPNRPHPWSEARHAQLPRAPGWIAPGVLPSPRRSPSRTPRAGLGAPRRGTSPSSRRSRAWPG